jgi:hypothetical protein
VILDLSFVRAPSYPEQKAAMRLDRRSPKEKDAALMRPAG